MAGSGAAGCGRMTAPVCARLSLKFSELPRCAQPRSAFGTAGCADAAAVTVRINATAAAFCAIWRMGKKRLRDSRGSQMLEPRSGWLAEVDNARGAIFGPPGEQKPVGAPGQRGHRRVTRLLGQDFRAVLDAHKQHHAVAIAGRHDG